MENRNMQEIIWAIENEASDERLKEFLSDYHENDIAEAFEKLNLESRKRLYHNLDLETASEMFSYVDNVSKYLDEMSLRQAAVILEHMDSNDAVDALDDIEDENKRELLISMMGQDASEDVRLISSYDDDEIGSLMTTKNLPD